MCCRAGDSMYMYVGLHGDVSLVTGETCLEMNHFLSGTGSPRSRPACQMCVDL